MHTDCYWPSFPAVQPNARRQTEEKTEKTYYWVWGPAASERERRYQSNNSSRSPMSGFMSPCIYFCRRAREGQRNLTKSNFLFLQDENNKWYATMAHDESSKTRQRGRGEGVRWHRYKLRETWKNLPVPGRSPGMVDIMPSDFTAVNSTLTATLFSSYRSDSGRGQKKQCGSKIDV